MADMADRREDNAGYLSQLLDEIDGIEPQRRSERVTRHCYHLFISRYDPEPFGGLHRDQFVAALNAEGIPCATGYVPLYRVKAIQSAISRLRSLVAGRDLPYAPPDCPVTERACAEEGVWFTQRMLLGTHADMDDIADAIRKVKRHAADLPA
jgi:dTDP-4-amino-4,6-dideoxygalactose transaminase